ncbi:MAG: 6-carboxytetrahydropterin synthase, partial [Gammaproteobacteria bacterium]
DFSYLCPERGLLGESWQVDIFLKGNLDQQGMVLDFSDVKKKVKNLIDEEFDHKLIIPARYARCTMKPHGKALHCLFEMTNGEQISHTAPDTAYCLLDSERVTTDALAAAIQAKLQPVLPQNVEEIRLSIYPEIIDGAYYHYSHGLKQHEGNCQRIAHGHRSKIEIFENGEPLESLEQFWAEQWRDIYIGTRSDILQESQRNGKSYLTFRYQACQGDFEISLPASRCYLIETDSTVENLAEHIALESARLNPGKKLEIFAYEGIDKGAVANT